MADKNVVIGVKLNASGNMSQVAKAATMDMNLLGTSVEKAARKAEANKQLLAGMNAAGLSGAPIGTRQITMADFMGPGKGSTISTGYSMSDFDKVTPKGPSQGQIVVAELKTFADGLTKASLTVGAMNAAALGFVAAASPAAFETLTGSIKLAAGEIGIILIPAVVKVSRFFQDVAEKIRAIDNATFGLIGRFLAAAAVPATIITMGGAAVGATRWLFGLSASAQAASASLNSVAVSGAGASAGNVAGGLRGFAGSAFGRIGLGALAVTGANMAGDAVGGNAGNAISNIGGGAAIGATIGSFIPVIGTAIGAGVGAIVGAIKTGFEWQGKEAKIAKMSMNFQGGGGDIGSLHDVIQSEAIKDPMQQAQANQQAAATEKLAREVGILSSAIARNQPWQAGG